MASTTAKGKYPEQLIAMVSAETKAFIRDKAAETDRSISEVARDYLEAGIVSLEYPERHLVAYNDPDDGAEVSIGDQLPAPRKSDPTFF